jgi:hypothetical protein
MFTSLEKLRIPSLDISRFETNMNQLKNDVSDTQRNLQTQMNKLEKVKLDADSVADYPVFRKTIEAQQGKHDMLIAELHRQKTDKSETERLHHLIEYKADSDVVSKKADSTVIEPLSRDIDDIKLQLYEFASLSSLPSQRVVYSPGRTTQNSSEALSGRLMKLELTLPLLEETKADRAELQQLVDHINSTIPVVKKLNPVEPRPLITPSPPSPLCRSCNQPVVTPVFPLGKRFSSSDRPNSAFVERSHVRSIGHGPCLTTSNGVHTNATTHYSHLLNT